jgi:hypothetical protein
VVRESAPHDAKPKSPTNEEPRPAAPSATPQGPRSQASSD